MNFVTNVLHLLSSGAIAYFNAYNMRDSVTRPSTIAGLQLAESGSVPFLETLQKRASAEGDQWLAENLARHANDELRHGQIFAQALKQMGKQVIDFKSLPESELAKRRRSPFFETYFEGYSREEIKGENIDWLVFMASTYILELDAAKEFARMANVLSEDDTRSRALKKGILSIAKDETRHAAYLYEGLQRRLTTDEVDSLVQEWRMRKIKAIWAALTEMLQTGGRRSSIVTDGVPPETELEILEVA